jgi:hypothetical protein
VYNYNIYGTSRSDTFFQLSFFKFEFEITYVLKSFVLVGIPLPTMESLESWKIAGKLGKIVSKTMHIEQNFK